MLFNSIEFAIFFPIVVALFFLSPQRLRTGLLLVASCFFYMAFIPAYILILFVTILIDYFAGMYIETAEGRNKKVALYVSIISTCAVLLIFKYLNFTLGSVDALSTLFGIHLGYSFIHIILPIGLSFHTFQSLSYVIEVYRGKQTAERNFIVYSTYVMFFPQLVAGPIERPQNLLHQFREWHDFNHANVTTGLKRMAWGFYKKLVVADRLALYVNDVYGAPRHFNGLQLTIATIFFAFQIYCDFSGYSDIAIGAAQILGFRLMENFRTPYYALSIAEFWHRWHISLSTWFKDYVYISLGGGRVSKIRHIFNLLITFGISGLWHGANWTYVWWGCLNGFYLVVGMLTVNWRSRLFSSLGLSDQAVSRKAIKLVCTFILTCIAWIVFRAHSMSDVSYIVTHLFRGWDFTVIATPQFLLRQLPVAVASIVVLEIGQLIGRSKEFFSTLTRIPLPARWAVYATFVVAVILFGVYQNRQFIYFQF
jgi:alginate O-acetyltransferase complex protein AlgI